MSVPDLETMRLRDQVMIVALADEPLAARQQAIDAYLARHEQMVRTKAAEQVTAYRCAYEMCSRCSCRADLTKLIGDTDER